MTPYGHSRGVGLKIVGHSSVKLNFTPNTLGCYGLRVIFTVTAAHRLTQRTLTSDIIPIISFNDNFAENYG